MSLALFDVNNIELAQINLFLYYTFYIHTYVENIKKLTHASQWAAKKAEQREYEQILDNLTKTVSARI